jgi:hypothetical protein
MEICNSGRPYPDVLEEFGHNFRCILFVCDGIMELLLATGSLRTSTQTKVGRARMTHLQGECSCKLAEKRVREIQRRSSAWSQECPADAQKRGWIRFNVGRVLGLTSPLQSRAEEVVEDSRDSTSVD